MRLLLFLFPLSLFAIDYAPWYGKRLEVEATVKQTYQHYPYIRQEYHRIDKTSDNWLTAFSAEVAICDDFKVATQLDFADTEHMSYNFEDARLSLQYRPLNDIVLDPVSLNLGLTTILPTQLALHDVSLFHSGLFETEAFVSIGREQSCEDFWTSRVWGYLALGLASRGSPWLRAQATYEKNFWDLHRWRIQAEYLQGFGKHCVRPHHFRGWGGINYTSLDLKAAYFYALENGEIGLELAYRPYAYNFPAEAASIQIRYMVPFGISTLIPCNAAKSLIHIGDCDE